MNAKEAYEKFKHLDEVLSGKPYATESLEWHIICDLWDAVKTEALKENFGTVITSLANSFDVELYSKSQSELEKYWFFKWDVMGTIKQNTYRFFDLLKLYEGQCRRWEEHHNGSCCVVERVRDQYIMPKIKIFIKTLTEALKEEATNDKP